MRHSVTTRIVVGLVFVVSIVAAGGSVSQGQTPASVNRGVYTAAQAGRGGKVFADKCTACHDTSRFTGSDFVRTWSGKPLHALYDHVKTTMPEDNPGSLQPQQYADVLAYFLQLNAYPTGADELKGTDEAMKAVQMELPKKGLMMMERRR